MNRWLLVAIFILCAGARADTTTLVGRGVDLRDVLLPGPELRVRKSSALADPLMLRITATYPHGTLGFRYDFHCVPLVAGKHDLTQFLESAAGESVKGLPPLIVEATGVLPATPPRAGTQPGRKCSGFGLSSSAATGAAGKGGTLAS